MCLPATVGYIKYRQCAWHASHPIHAIASDRLTILFIQIHP